MFKTKQMIKALHKIMSEGEISLVIKNGKKRNGSYHREIKNGRWYETVIIKKLWYTLDLCETDLITIAHELGHCSSFRYGFIDKELNIAYTLLDDYKNLFESQKILILDEEIRAWDYALPILKHIKFTNWSLFFKRKNYCLNKYEKTLNSLIKKIDKK